MRKLLIFLFLMLTSFSCAFARTADSRNFASSADSLYMITLGTLNKLGFNVVEMQAASGYISFKNSSGDEYLIMISENGESSSNLKILKLKNSSPLIEVQDIIYQALNNEIYNAPKRADQ